MLKRLLQRVVDYPPILDVVRRIIEADFRKEREVIRREFGSMKGNVLDIPCGTGLFSPLFSADAYTGVDLGEKYVQRARKRYPDKKFLVGDACALPFPDASFTRILVIGFFHHLEEPAIARSIKEFHRMLKSNGMLLLIEDAPTRSSWNVLGRLLQSLDQGGRIRPAEYYASMLQKFFTIEKEYPLRAGLWDYTVFLLRKSS